MESKGNALICKMQLFGNLFERFGLNTSIEILQNKIIKLHRHYSIVTLCICKFFVVILLVVSTTNFELL